MACRQSAIKIMHHVLENVLDTAMYTCKWQGKNYKANLIDLQHIILYIPVVSCRAVLIHMSQPLQFQSSDLNRNVVKFNEACQKKLIDKQ